MTNNQFNESGASAQHQDQGTQANVLFGRKAAGARLKVFIFPFEDLSFCVFEKCPNIKKRFDFRHHFNKILSRL